MYNACVKAAPSMFEGGLLWFSIVFIIVSGHLINYLYHSHLVFMLGYISTWHTHAYTKRTNYNTKVKKIAFILKESLFWWPGNTETEYFCPTCLCCSCTCSLFHAQGDMYLHIEHKNRISWWLCYNAYELSLTVQQGTPTSSPSDREPSASSPTGISSVTFARTSSESQVVVVLHTVLFLY